jgi:hypothetical protein
MIQRLAAWLGWHLAGRQRKLTDDEKFAIGVAYLALITELVTPKPKPRDECFCGNPDCWYSR